MIEKQWSQVNFDFVMFILQNITIITKVNKKFWVIKLNTHGFIHHFHS